MAGKIKTVKPNAFQRLAHRFLMLKPVSALLSKILYRADMFVLRLTKGKYDVTRYVGLPIIQLTTKGAKTGQLRTIPLVSLPDGGKIALIASSFGREHNPGWYYNLKKHPECDVLSNGRTGKYIARELEGDDYDHYWRLAVSYYAGYETYKERASHRHIPVMLLEPKK